MRVLMCMRDPVPPMRPDVAALFDEQLRRRGIATDFAGRGQSPRARPAHGATFATSRGTGALAAFASGIAMLGLVLRRGREYDLVVVRDLPIVAALLFPIAGLLGMGRAYWMSFPAPLGDRINAAIAWRAGQRVRAVVAWSRGVLAGLAERLVTLPLAHHVFVQSDAMAQATFGDRATGRCTAVPMGIDASRLLAAATASDPVDLGPGRWIVYLGSLDAVRRIDVLVDAFAQVHARMPDARLALVGGAERETDVRALETQVRRAGLSDVVRFAGALPMIEAWRWVRAARVGVSPIPPGPLYDVSSPTKTIEYLALGVPCVGNAIPDQYAVLQASGGGRCCDFSVAGFADAIAAVLAEPLEARRMGAAGRAWVLRHRDYEVLAERVCVALVALRRRPSTGNSRRLGSR